MLNTNGIQIPVLCYHQISNEDVLISVSPPLFEHQMKWLSEHKNCVSLQDVIDWYTKDKPLPKNPIAITFDDGYIDNLKIAAPIILKYGLKATVFALAKPTSHEGGKKMGKSELCELSSLGWDIESHGLSHRIFSKLTDMELSRELEESKQILSDYLNRNVTMIAYPKGAILESQHKLISSYYQAGWSVKPKQITKNDNLYDLPRIGILKNTSMMSFIFYTSKLFNIYSQKKNHL